MSFDAPSGRYGSTGSHSSSHASSLSSPPLHGAVAPDAAKVERLHTLLSELSGFDGQLCELHTHLLGMGNAKFWVHGLLLDSYKLPPDHRFREDLHVRESMGPLVWMQKDARFLDPRQAAAFFKQVSMVEGRCVKELKERLSRDSQLPGQLLQQWNQLFSTSFLTQLSHSDDLSFHTHFCFDVVLQLDHLIDAFGLQQNKPRDLLQAAVEDRLGVGRSMRAQPGFRGIQQWIIFNAREQRMEIVSGLRCEDLRMLCGGFVTPDATRHPLHQDALAHVLNCFSMSNADGSQPRNIDFHTFRGNFTPEFYPRRYKLKDSLYGQRLDVLALLLQHALKRYDSSSPAVRYVEFSVGLGDLSRPWVFDVLQCFQPKDVQPLNKAVAEAWTKQKKQGQAGAEMTLPALPAPPAATAASSPAAAVAPSSPVAAPSYSSFRALLEHSLSDKQSLPFPWLARALPSLFRPTADPEPALSTPKVTYRFLIGFSRQKVHLDQRYLPLDKLPMSEQQQHALDFLNERPHVALKQTLDEIQLSRNAEDTVMFTEAVEELRTLRSQFLAQAPLVTEGDAKSKARSEKPRLLCPSLYFRFVVGIDLFGDELGFPYIPFVTHEFLQFVQDTRQLNEAFGVRVHGGENVPVIPPSSPGYRMFAAHMHCLFRSLAYLRARLGKRIRIGHGIAFSTVLPSSAADAAARAQELQPFRLRKSSVLMAELRELALPMLKDMLVEVNITSNAYLLYDAVRDGAVSDFDARGAAWTELHREGVPIALSTDNDGIWPLDQCEYGHHAHHSLALEFCKAITSGFISSTPQLKAIVNKTQGHRFDSTELKPPSQAATQQPDRTKDRSKIARLLCEYADVGRLPFNELAGHKRAELRPFHIIFHPDAVRVLQCGFPAPREEQEEPVEAESVGAAMPAVEQGGAGFSKAQRVLLCSITGVDAYPLVSAFSAQYHDKDTGGSWRQQTLGAAMVALAVHVYYDVRTNGAAYEAAVDRCVGIVEQLNLHQRLLDGSSSTTSQSWESRLRTFLRSVYRVLDSFYGASTPRRTALSQATFAHVCLTQSWHAEAKARESYTVVASFDSPDPLEKDSATVLVDDMLACMHVALPPPVRSKPRSPDPKAIIQRDVTLLLFVPSMDEDEWSMLKTAVCAKPDLALRPTPNARSDRVSELESSPLIPDPAYLVRIHIDVYSNAFKNKPRKLEDQKSPARLGGYEVSLRFNPNPASRTGAMTQVVHPLLYAAAAHGGALTAALQALAADLPHGVLAMADLPFVLSVRSFEEVLTPYLPLQFLYATPSSGEVAMTVAPLQTATAKLQARLGTLRVDTALRSRVQAQDAASREPSLPLDLPLTLAREQLQRAVHDGGGKVRTFAELLEHPLLALAQTSVPADEPSATPLQAEESKQAQIPSAHDRASALRVELLERCIRARRLGTRPLEFVILEVKDAAVQAELEALAQFADLEPESELQLHAQPATAAAPSVFPPLALSASSRTDRLPCTWLLCTHCQVLKEGQVPLPMIDLGVRFSDDEDGVQSWLEADGPAPALPPEQRLLVERRVEAMRFLASTVAFETFASWSQLDWWSELMLHYFARLDGLCWLHAFPWKKVAGTNPHVQPLALLWLKLVESTLCAWQQRSSTSGSGAPEACPRWRALVNAIVRGSTFADDMKSCHLFFLAQCSSQIHARLVVHMGLPLDAAQVPAEKQGVLLEFLRDLEWLPPEQCDKNKLLDLFEQYLVKRARSQPMAPGLHAQPSSQSAVTSAATLVSAPGAAPRSAAAHVSKDVALELMQVLFHATSKLQTDVAALVEGVQWNCTEPIMVLTDWAQHTEQYTCKEELRQLQILSARLGRERSFLPPLKELEQLVWSLIRVLLSCSSKIDQLLPLPAPAAAAARPGADALALSRTRSTSTSSGSSAPFECEAVGRLLRASCTTLVSLLRHRAALVESCLEHSLADALHEAARTFLHLHSCEGSSRRHLCGMSFDLADLSRSCLDLMERLRVAVERGQAKPTVTAMRFAAAPLPCASDVHRKDSQLAWLPFAYHNLTLVMELRVGKSAATAVAEAQHRDLLPLALLFENMVTSTLGQPAQHVFSFCCRLLSNLADEHPDFTAAMQRLLHHATTGTAQLVRLFELWMREYAGICLAVSLLPVVPEESINAVRSAVLRVAHRGLCDQSLRLSALPSHVVLLYLCLHVCAMQRGPSQLSDADAAQVAGVLEDASWCARNMDAVEVPRQWDAVRHVISMPKTVNAEIASQLCSNVRDKFERMRRAESPARSPSPTVVRGAASAAASPSSSAPAQLAPALRPHTAPSDIRLQHSAPSPLRHDGVEHLSDELQLSHAGADRDVAAAAAGAHVLTTDFPIIDSDIDVPVPAAAPVDSGTGSGSAGSGPALDSHSQQPEPDEDVQ